MAIQKEAVEIHCAACGSAFRLWVPTDTLREWEHGARINCVRCGASHLVSKTGGAFSAVPIKTTEQEPVSAPSAPSTQPQAEARPSRMEREIAPPKAPAEAPLRGPQAVSAPARSAAHEEAEEAPGQGLETVLLVDDDKFSRQMAENTLANMSGIRLLVMKNAAEALRTVKTEDVKLIITDLYLKNPTDPEALLDGEDLLKRLLDMGLHIPAIVTTGKDIIDDLVLDPKWFEMHVKGFIQKGNPFWAEELKLKINEVMYKG